MKQFHFVLVHGACHGAWCWYKVVTLLTAAGHRATAVDLGGCGVNPRTLAEIRTLDDYVHPLMDFMGSIDSHYHHHQDDDDDDDDHNDKKVILVGHSFGGIAMSFAMQKFPQKILAAVFSFRRTPVEEYMDTRFWYDNGPENAPTSVLLGPQILAGKFFQNCQPEDIELGKMLVRPQGVFSEDLAKEGLFTEDKYGAVERVYVKCEEDEQMKLDFQEWIIERSPPQQPRMNVKSIPKADHMVMLSKPLELTLCLLEIAHQYD
ncbi:hypothetical protein Cgig2_008053 [Carnegiea gigantea]|uniref:AB hydrolase-1 domain-containing protein n=1 Tax=Carnegiea gigantea TaxID=171969 RepID=A0A9Q1L0N8_9CARY|nr:hypothetical protein Cgig2_008053 [Carnegiea gigantea]